MILPHNEKGHLILVQDYIMLHGTQNIMTEYFWLNKVWNGWVRLSTKSRIAHVRKTSLVQPRTHVIYLLGKLFSKFPPQWLAPLWVSLTLYKKHRNASLGCIFDTILPHLFSPENLKVLQGRDWCLWWWFQGLSWSYLSRIISHGPDMSL